MGDKFQGKRGDEKKVKNRKEKKGQGGRKPEVGKKSHLSILTPKKGSSLISFSPRKGTFMRQTS
jgi:hypothetical protein